MIAAHCFMDSAQLKYCAMHGVQDMPFGDDVVRYTMLSKPSDATTSRLDVR
jgi:hypothetical protein